MKIAQVRRHGKQSLQMTIGRTLIFLTTVVLAGFGVYQYFALQTEKVRDLYTFVEISTERLTRSLAVSKLVLIAEAEEVRRKNGITAES